MIYDVELWWNVSIGSMTLNYDWPWTLTHFSKCFYLGYISCTRHDKAWIPGLTQTLENIKNAENKFPAGKNLGIWQFYKKWEFNYSSSIKLTTCGFFFMIFIFIKVVHHLKEIFLWYKNNGREGEEQRPLALILHCYSENFIWGKNI